MKTKVQKQQDIVRLKEEFVGAGNAMAYHFDLSVNLPSRDEAGRTTTTQFIS